MKLDVKVNNLLRTMKQNHKKLLEAWESRIFFFFFEISLPVYQKCLSRNPSCYDPALPFLPEHSVAPSTQNGRP